MGIPRGGQKFDFDGHADNGIGDISAANVTPLTKTSYLIALGLLPSASPGKGGVSMWATSDLAITPDALVGTAPSAALLGFKRA